MTARRFLVNLIQLNPNAIWKKDCRGLYIDGVCLGDLTDLMEAFDAVWNNGYLRTISHEPIWETVRIPRYEEIKW